MEAPVANQSRGFLGKFRGSLRNFLKGGPPSHKKHLGKFFKILSQGFLVTWFGDLFTTHFSRKNRVSCTMRVFFKTGFWFFLNIFHISCLRFLELSIFDDICEYDA